MAKKKLFTPGAPPENEHMWGLYNCTNTKALADSNLDIEMVKRLNDSGIETYRSIAHKFPRPGGVTAVVIVGASRADAHCWPEFGTCMLGCFACGDKDKQMYDFLYRMIRYLRPRDTYEIPERVIYPYLPSQVPFTWTRIEAPFVPKRKLKN
jgi:S-adenosylmethionine/arginine decarboxylase-like enzyme